MKPAMFLPRAIASRKPPHGAPCNRCGICCLATLCPLGQRLFGGELGPCPALEPAEGGAFACGVVANPIKHARRAVLQHGAEKVSEAALLLIGGQTGCDARINGEPKNESFYEMLLDHDRRTRGATNRAKRVFGVVP